MHIQCRDTDDGGAVQLPARDNVNTPQLWWRGGLRGLANCRVSYGPSEHDTRTTTHIPHGHTFDIPGIYCQTEAMVPVWILTGFSFMTASAHDTHTVGLYCSCFLRNRRLDHMRSNIKRVKCTYFDTFVTKITFRANNLF